MARIRLRAGVDAGAAAGIEPQLLQAAFDAAGDAQGLQSAVAGNVMQVKYAP